MTLNRMERTAAENARFSNPDDDPRGPWFSDNRTAPGAQTHQGMVYGIQHPLTREVVYPAVGRCWTFSQEDILRDLREWADFELRDIGDEEQRARVCGIPASDVRPGSRPSSYRTPPNPLRSTCSHDGLQAHGRSSL